MWVGVDGEVGKGGISKSKIGGCLGRCLGMMGLVREGGSISHNLIYNCIIFKQVYRLFIQIRMKIRFLSLQNKHIWKIF